MLYIAARRAGKDIMFWNLAIRQCLKRTCLVFYVLPTYSQGRKAIWDAIAIDGTKFLEYVPPEVVAAINQAEMKIRFINGSILQVIGGDTYDTSLVGTNPYAVILSEYSLMPPDIFSFIRPILAANGGWCAIVGTPRGKNHMWQFYKIVKDLPEWKVFIHKASEIHHIPANILAQEKSQMDEGLYLQEYECSFERGISGSFYGTHLDNLRLKNQICHVPYDPGLLVYTSFDIGVNDPTTIIFWQQVDGGNSIRIIDCYSNNNLGLDHYIHIINSKSYNYGGHYAPHDIKVREFGGGAITRYEKARQLGLTFKLIEQVPLLDGIENVWTHFSKFWIDSEKCRSLIDALENYRKDWDETHQIFLPKPAPRQWASHYADSLRYLCLAIHRTKKGMTSEDYERKKMEAMGASLSPVQRFLGPDYGR